jgi:probable HAF family extracellular repeat protein
MIRKLLFISTGVWAMAASSAMAASFLGLGDLPGGGFNSIASSLSSDGSIVVGYGTTSQGEQAFRWTKETGMVGLGNLSNGSFRGTWANDVSAQGTVIVGYGDPVGSGWDTYRGFLWTQAAGMVEVGSLNGSARFMAFAVSADGRVVVGDGGLQAFRWVQGSGISGLGVLPGLQGSRAVAVSADGSVVTGSCYSVNWTSEQAFRWTPADGMQSLGAVPGYANSFPNAISPDGSVIAGTIASSSAAHAFRWTRETGMVSIGGLPGMPVNHPGAATANGSIIVGGSYTDATHGTAFIWDAVHGMRSLQAMLQTDYGLNLTGWNLQSAMGVTPDGSVIVGFGTNPSGQQEAFRVEVSLLPDPNGPVYNLSTGQRFASIQTAINYAQLGQVILVSPGQYNENLILPNKPFTIRSANPQDSAVVSLTTLTGDGSSPAVTVSPGTALRSMQGLTIVDGADGVVCSGARLELSRCVLTSHRDCGIEVSDESTLAVDHCIVAGNVGPGLRSVPKTTGRGLLKLSKVDLTQCTIVQNRGYALEGDGVTVANSILYGNGISAGGLQIKGNNVKVTYSDLHGGFAGQGNLDADPAFVASGSWTDPNTYAQGDYHLKSTAGHWNPRTCTWVLDDVTSPCIDAGDPNAAFDLEPQPSGGRVNLGAFGNTPQASKSISQ